MSAACIDSNPIKQNDNTVVQADVHLTLAQLQVGCLEKPSPWSITPSVYSMLLINVEQTVRKGALYPAKPYHEDVDFAHLCNEKGLIVARCNWLYFHKVFVTYYCLSIEIE